jgi:hypothetical protein
MENVVPKIMRVLQEHQINPLEWPKWIAFAYVTFGMNALTASHEAGEGRLKKNQAALLKILDDSYVALAEWTPDVPNTLQLQARFGTNLPGV